MYEEAGLGASSFPGPDWLVSLPPRHRCRSCGRPLRVASACPPEL